MARHNDPAADAHQPVLVVGLGRFGGAVAQSLVRLGHEVLAVDDNPALVRKWAHELTHVVEADGTDEDALRQLGAGSFTRAVVGIGTDIEASVLSVLALTEIGVADVWAKAITGKHGKILQRVGARHVVFPEHAMGERVAHVVTGSMIDYIEFDDGFAIARTRSPKEAFGRTLADSALRTRYGVTVVGVKRPGLDFTYARPETEVHDRDELIVSGPTEKVQRFSALAAQRRWT
ncbi:MAG TPA: TrkA family potassium uptake protein [Nocardioidaceae bacterium]|nr:TrkA family potassium uptake protein [Nocardioidaceae bacterium]